MTSINEEEHKQELELSAAGAVNGFAAWLTTRNQTVKLGAKENASPVVDLVAQFNKVNNLGEPVDADFDILKHPEEDYQLFSGDVSLLPPVRPDDPSHRITNIKNPKYNCDEAYHGSAATGQLELSDFERGAAVLVVDGEGVTVTVSSEDRERIVELYGRSEDFWLPGIDNMVPVEFSKLLARGEFVVSQNVRIS